MLRRWWKTLIYLVFLFLSLYLVSKGVKVMISSFFAGLLVFPVLPILFIKEIGPNIGLSNKKRETDFINNFVLLITIIVGSIFFFETGLRVQKRLFPPLQGPGIPEELRTKEVKIPGAIYARYWHNKLHVYNQSYMRWSSPFPIKKSVFRIIVIGDSVTYGDGVAIEDTYSALIERELKKQYRAEVLNLGYDGAQPDDILKKLKELLPLLKPDLVIYGISQNDFMPPGTSPYSSNMAFQFPFPPSWKYFIIQNYEIGRFLNGRYNNTLLKLGLRDNYLTDTLKNKDGYQDYFAKTTKEMNNYVLSNHLPPIVAMVLDHTTPKPGEITWRVTQVAEKYLKDAGMTVLPAEDYYLKYNNLYRNSLYVSEWERHPNEKAHQMYAEFFLNFLENLPLLDKYRKS